MCPGIYFLRKYPVLWYRIINCSHMIYIRSSEFFTLYNCNFILWPTFPYFPYLPIPGNHCSTLCFYEFDIFRFHIWARLGSIFFCVWLLLLSIMSSRFIHVVTNDSISLDLLYLRLLYIHIHVYVYVYIHDYVLKRQSIYWIDKWL